MTSEDTGPGRGSWRIVARALRVGHQNDPRYEALTRETAERNVHNGWLFVLFAVALAFQCVLVVLRLKHGAGTFGTVATASSALFLEVGLGIIWVARRRGRRYLEKADGDRRSEGRR